MSEEILEEIEGQLTNDGVAVPNAQLQGELEKRGFGDREEQSFTLRDYEALFLAYTGKLKVKKNKKEVSFTELVGYAQEKDKDAWTRFLIYRDLRSRGYVAKEGFGFRVDFRVYDRGEYGAKAAKYVVFGLNEGTEITSSELAKMAEQIRRMGKEPVIAVIERRGETIYYKVSKMRFEKPT